MGFLDDLLGGVMGGAAGQPEPGRRQAQAGGGMGPGMMALLPVVLQMLASRGSRQGGGGLGDILGQVLGGGQPGGGGIGDVLGGLTGRGAAPGGDAGGLGDLLERMQRTGYGDQARSWV